MFLKRWHGLGTREEHLAPVLAHSRGCILELHEFFAPGEPLLSLILWFILKFSFSGQEPLVSESYPFSFYFFHQHLAFFSAQFKHWRTESVVTSQKWLRRWGQRHWVVELSEAGHTQFLATGFCSLSVSGSGFCFSRIGAASMPGSFWDYS